MSKALIVVAAVCGTLGAALMRPGLVSIGLFCIFGSFIADANTARKNRRTR